MLHCGSFAGGRDMGDMGRDISRWHTVMEVWGLRGSFIKGSSRYEEVGI